MPRKTDWGVEGSDEEILAGKSKPSMDTNVQTGPGGGAPPDSIPVPKPIDITAQNDYKAWKEDNPNPIGGMYNPNAASFQIGNAYGGTLDAELAKAQGFKAPTSTAAGMAGYATAQGATMGLAQSNEARGRQMALADALRRRAAGDGTSLAELQLRRGLDQQMADQRSMAASARGVNPALAARAAANNIGLAQARTSADTAMLRASEQQQAEAALGGVLSGVRGQDIGTATSQAGFNQQANLLTAQNLQQKYALEGGWQQQTNQANQQAELQNRAQMQQAIQTYLGMGMSREEAQQKALAEMEMIKAGQMQAYQQRQLTAKLASGEADTRDKAAWLGLAGTVIGGVGGGIVGGPIGAGIGASIAGKAAETITV